MGASCTKGTGVQTRVREQLAKPQTNTMAHKAVDKAVPEQYRQQAHSTVDKALQAAVPSNAQAGGATQAPPPNGQTQGYGMQAGQQQYTTNAAGMAGRPFGDDDAQRYATPGQPSYGQGRPVVHGGGGGGGQQYVQQTPGLHYGQYGQGGQQQRYAQQQQHDAYQGMR
ncbi:SMP domain-containing protein [Plasmodiophora brassicae]|uniref:Uncharacterized protein n=1 Tax=Plasmodiophora brassicae TaxID=37360 RepID=A0A0G4IT93_PLABS|nr:hypothetical protein PBRA_006599 [Plasmodiophora brassicae]SPQ95884.1 unnamed protein product [Plasmodiophora brassicae]